MKGREFLYYLSNYKLHKKDCYVELNLNSLIIGSLSKEHQICYNILIASNSERKVGG
jgi:hypothetical protein